MSLLSLAEPALPPPQIYSLLKGKQLTPKRRRRMHSVCVQCTLTAKRIALHCFHLAKRNKKDKQSLKTQQANSRKGPEEISKPTCNKIVHLLLCKHLFVACKPSALPVLLSLRTKVSSCGHRRRLQARSTVPPPALSCDVRKCQHQHQQRLHPQQSLRRSCAHPHAVDQFWPDDPRTARDITAR